MFGLSYLLGVELMPRIRNWQELKFYRPSKETHYEHIDALFGDNVVDWDLIRTHWRVRSQHILADEIRAKGRKIIVWMAFAMDVASRVWLAGVVSEQRDRPLIDLLLQRTRACCQFMQGLLVCTDGLASYPKSIMRAFREKVKKHGGRGRCSLEIWPDLCIAKIIKHTKKKRVVEITRKVTRGTSEKAKELLGLTKGCLELNTAFIERSNGTFENVLPL